MFKAITEYFSEEAKAARAIRAKVGRFNSYMRDGGCMGGEAFTPAEELNLVDALVRNIERHPRDWRFNGHTAVRRDPDICVWISSGVEFVGVYEGKNTLRNGRGLRSKSQRRLFDALHKIRHQYENDSVTDLVKALDPPHEQAVRQLVDQTKRAVAV